MISSRRNRMARRLTTYRLWMSPDSIPFHQPSLSYTVVLERQNSQARPHTQSSQAPDRITPVNRMWGVAACMLFILLGCLLIPYAGIQNDEALFSLPMFGSLPAEGSISIFKRHLPTMVMSYVGALKTWLYAPLFAIWQPSPWSIRLPMVIAGGLTIWLFFLLLNRLAGSRAAIAGAFLLATEPSYLVTTTFDWGPTTLQILLLTSALFAAATKRYRLAALFLGLAMWNKAIFAWALAGLGAATLIVYPKELWRGLRTREALGALALFAVGAFPLINYNMRKPMNTFRGNAKVAIANIGTKVHHVELAANGSGLFGYITGEEWMDNPKTAECAVARWGGALRDRIGEHRKTLGVYAFFLALALVPIWWRARRLDVTAEFESTRRPLLFSLVFLGVAWLLMAMTQDAGGATHHTILLWPFPVLFVVVAFSAALRPNWLFAPVIAVLLIANLLVINQYNVQFARNGTTGVWSDAIFGLSKDLPGIPASHIYVTDWGVVNSLALLHQAKLPLVVASDPLVPEAPSDADRQSVLRMLADTDGVFVSHTPAYEEFKGNAKRLDAIASAAGYSRELLLTVPDANGRQVFEVTRFHKADPRSAGPH
ncbi:MAG: glycosyltransferase family 39 protein [Bryobacteraceae bacterium]